MRNEPGRSCRITMKTSAELVVDATAFHCAERIEGHIERLALAGANVVAKQKTEGDWPREFRRSAKATIRCVVSRCNLFVSLVKNRGLQFARGQRLFTDNL